MAILWAIRRKHCQSEIEAQAARIPSTVERLRFLRASMEAHQANSRRIVLAARIAGVSAVLAIAAAVAVHSAQRIKNAAPGVAAASNPAGDRMGAAPEVNVWLVEKHAGIDIYSNGLEIRNDYLAASEPRGYYAVSRATWTLSEARSKPVGIVFHTTESQMVPFESYRNDSLKKHARGVLGWVRDRRLYNFVIDRFGRVYRIVPEDQRANHAGHSIWAEGASVYVDLNQSFLGISFEAETRSGTDATPFEASPAQVHAGRILTEMLRSAYHIPAANCVTHAQVSVNPDNMRIGYHTDWGSHFPFREMGLNEGYESPVASVSVFGFGYDASFIEAIGGKPWTGLVAAEGQVEKEAGVRGTTTAGYRSYLQRQYKKIIASMGSAATPEETVNDKS